MPISSQGCGRYFAQGLRLVDIEGAERSSQACGRRVRARMVGHGLSFADFKAKGIFEHFNEGLRLVWSARGAERQLYGRVASGQRSAVVVDGPELCGL